MSQVIIRSKITTALVAWAGSKSPAIQVARENQAFTKPANSGTFVELVIVPANTFTSTLDGTGRRFLGEVIINIWVKDGIGAGLTETLAEELAQLFPRVPLNYLPLVIESWPTLKRSVIVDEGYRVSTVCFNYRFEA